eukprot:1152712-Pelagomonas_calceolata.AAC.2
MRGSGSSCCKAPTSTMMPLRYGEVAVSVGEGSRGSCFKATMLTMMLPRQNNVALKLANYRHVGPTFAAASLEEPCGKQMGITFAALTK